ncbi:hypothetical protein [Mesorhizobium sp. M0491]|uniref:hypothetical protein n=1 Tax=Mesorhizobium sp. M0491 TaxID=2956950 RepID=UPI0033365C8F
MNDPEISPALRKLLDIMTSPDVPMARSVDAARAVIEFEVPQEVYDLTHAFLLGVAECGDLKLAVQALQLLRKVEARRVIPGVAKAADPAEGLGKRLEEARVRVEAKRRY